MLGGQTEVREAGDEVAIFRGHEVVGSVKGFALHTYDGAQVLPAFGSRGRWPEIESTHDPLATAGWFVVTHRRILQVASRARARLRRTARIASF